MFLHLTETTNHIGHTVCLTSRNYVLSQIVLFNPLSTSVAGTCKISTPFKGKHLNPKIEGDINIIKIYYERHVCELKPCSLGRRLAQIPLFHLIVLVKKEQNWST